MRFNENYSSDSTNDALKSIESVLNNKESDSKYYG